MRVAAVIKNTCYFILLSVSAAATAAAQTTTTTSTTDGKTPAGMAPGSPAGSFALSGFDNINPFSQSLSFRLPLLQLGGRGTAGYAMTLPIERKWRVEHSITDYNPPCPQGGCEVFPPTHTYIANDEWWNATTPNYGPGVIKGRRSGSTDLTGCGLNSSVYARTMTRLTFTAADGTEYELRDQQTGGQPLPGQCPGSGNLSRGTVFVTADGTSATFVSDTPIYDYSLPNDYQPFLVTGYLFLRDGTRYRIDVNDTWIRDRNGNQVHYERSVLLPGGDYGTKITDSLGRVVTVTYATTARRYDEITYQGFGGIQRTVRVWYDNLDNRLRQANGQHGAEQPATYQSLFPTLYPLSNEPQNTQSYNPEVVSAVELPDQRRYNFYYNSYGELARVELPTGGAFEYDYQPGEGVTNVTGDNYEILRRVIERRIYGAGGSFESRMTFGPCGGGAYPTGAANTCTQVDQRDPNNGNAIVGSSRHTYYGNASPKTTWFDPIFYSEWNEGKEFITEALASDGATVLRRTEQNWRQRATPGWWSSNLYTIYGPEPANDPRVVETTTTLMDVSPNLVSKQSAINPTTQAVGFDQYNNQTDVYEYDYGAGAPGALVRRTHTDYLTTNSINGVDYASTNVSSASIHLRSLPTQQQIFDAGGIERSRTTFEYDNYASDTYHAWLADCPGISGLDSAFTTSYQTRGNATRVSRWLLSSGTSINSYAQYDVAGNTIKTIDGRGQVSQAGYSSSYQYAFPTSTTSPVPDPAGIYGTNSALTTSTVYDFSSGLIISSTDVNGQTTTVQYDDVLDRPTLVTRPSGGGWTSFQYGDTAGNLYVRTQTAIDTTRATDSYQYFDGLGRSVRSFQHVNSDPTKPWLTADIKYDSLGKMWKASNPYWSAGSGSAVNPSGNWTVTLYDALGRVKTVKSPDNAVVTTTYSGNQMTVTDQAGKSRRSVTDALGRMIQVVEDPGGLGYQTNYSYDALGNLHTVAQDTQRRYFMYDSLSRLIRTKAPEQNANPSLALSDPVSGNSQWSTAYTHDANGNLLTRTDARNVTATYAYDNVNRNITVNYSDGSHIDRTYDSAVNGRGRLRFHTLYPTTGAHSQTAIDAYDAMGRPLNQRQHFWANGGWGAAFATLRVYNLAGNVTSQLYPSGHIVYYNYDVAGRLADLDAIHPAFTGNLGDGVTRTYASALSYDEWNGINREKFGTDVPLYHKEHRNVRGQLYDVRLSTVNDEWNWNRGAVVNYYSFQPYGLGTSGPDNNGNLLLQQHWVPGDDSISSYSFMQQNYTYDSLNRLSWVGEYQNGATNTGNQNYSYDRYGNRTISSASGTSINGQQFAVDANTNRLGVPSGAAGVMQYDAAGNLTNDTYSGQGARGYDAENRMVTATNTSGLQSVYTYDSAGHRVRRQSYNQEVWQAYGMEGELLAEYAANASPSSPQQEYGYRGGQLLVTASAAPRTNFALASQGAVASASSTVDPGQGPSGAINGDRKGANWGNGGGWHDATAGAYPDWLQVDFNGSKTIDEIDVFSVQDNYTNPSEPTPTMTFSAYGVTGFDLQYWNGSAWVNIPGASVTGNNKVWKQVAFAPVTTSKIRVSINSSLWSYSRLTEVEAWGTDATPRTNVALASNGAVATASSEVAAGQGASGTNNGDRKGLNWGNGGGWHDATAGVYPDWLQVDFSGSKTIDEVDVFSVQDNYTNPSEPTESMTFSAYGVTDYQVQYWNGSAWAAVPGASVTGNNKVWRKFTFAALSTSKIRVLITNSLWNYSRLVEVEAWGGGGGGSTGNGAEVRWLVSDQLGTPRMIADKTGSLSGMRRHDYLPFGEELVAGSGGRTPQQGYQANDGVRQQFTQKERDRETGLDYFGARYYASTQGRFTSVDPLLSSGRLYDPQTWNRYSHTLNNPLKYVDPTGLYEFNAALGGSATDDELRRRAGNDKKSLQEAERIIERRDQFRAALAGAAAAAKSGDLTASQQQAVARAVNAYGTENDGNQVIVGFGKTGTGVGARTDGADINDNIYVTFKASHKGNDLIIDVVHEGSHIADNQAFNATHGTYDFGGSTDISQYETERRAYEVSSFAAQAVGKSSYPNNLEDSSSSREHQVWNSGWKAADREVKRSAGIDRLISTYYGVTKDKPGLTLGQIKERVP